MKTMTKNGRFLRSAIILFAAVLLNANAAAAAMSTDDFFALCETGTAREIETAIRDGADVNAKDKDGETALMYAIWNDSPEGLSILLQHGADVNAKDDDGWTALMNAAGNDSPRSLSILLQHGADPNANDDDGGTALMHAAFDGNPESISILLQHGADVNAKNNEGFMALMYATRNDNPEVLSILLQHGADPNAKHNNGGTALMHALFNDNPEGLSILLQHGADPNAKNDDGVTALVRAAFDGNPESISILLQHGADVNAKNDEGFTALMYATRNDNPEVLSILLQHGADPNAKNNDGRTALMYATREDSLEVVSTLLRHGADVNAKDKDGETALMYAVRSGKSPEIVSMLEEAARTREKKPERKAVSEKISGLTQSAQAAEIEGRYDEALKLSEDALKAAEAEYGGNHHVVADALENLGIVYGRLEKHGQALECDERAFGIRRKLFGEEHALVADSLNNMGVDYSNLGEHAKAKECDERALEIRRKLFGYEHAATAQSLNNLGVDCSFLEGTSHLDARLVSYVGMLYKSHFLINYARFIRRRILGDEYEDTAQSYYNLGILLSKTLVAVNGRMVGTPDLSKVIEVRERVLGKEHADTAAAFHVEALSRMEWWYGTTVEYAERALEIRLNLFGETHRDTADSFEALGNYYLEVGRYEDEVGEKYAKAREYHERTLKTRLNLFGEDSLETALSCHALSRCYENLDNKEKADEYKARASAIFSKIFSTDGLPLPEQIIGDIWEKLDRIHAGAKDFEKSKNSAGPIATLRVRSLNVAAFRVRSLNADLCEDLFDLDEFTADGDLNLMESEVSVLTKLGEDHAYTANALDSLARVYRERGYYEKASECDERALAIRTNVWGGDDKFTAQSLDNLGLDYAGLGNYARAKDCHERALGIQLRIISKLTMERHYWVIFKDGEARIYHISSGMPYDGLWFAEEFIRAEKAVLSALRNLEAVERQLEDNRAERYYRERASAFDTELYPDSDTFYDPEGMKWTARFYENVLDVWAGFGDNASEEDVYLAALLSETGRIRRELGGSENLKKAEEHLKRALLIYLKECGERDGNIAEVIYDDGLVASLFDLGMVYRDMGLTDTAIFCMKTAVNMIQETREVFGRHLERVMNEYEHSNYGSFHHIKRQYYIVLSNLLNERGNIPEARQVIDMLEDEPTDSINPNEENAQSESRVALSGAELEQYGRLNGIGGRLFSLNREKTGLLKKKECIPDAEWKTSADEARLAGANAALISAEDDFHAFFAGLK
jgi:ankyrin repeat protein